MKKWSGLSFILSILFIVTGCVTQGTQEDKGTLRQFSQLQPGEKIAVVTTSMGEFKIRFFPELAPKACENFITHAQDGYYNNITFHRVVKNFVIQGGDPTGTGFGGESIWEGVFENEVSPVLHHFRGALCMANAGPDTNSSQFYVVQGEALDKEALAYLKDPKKIFITDDTGVKRSYGEYLYPEAFKKYKPLFSDKVIEKYAEVGGQPKLDYGYTVFGQVFEGMETVDKISVVSTDERSRKPFEDVIIESVEIIEYQ